MSNVLNESPVHEAHATNLNTLAWPLQSRLCVEGGS
jgi:hypothetical protein